MKQVLMVDDRDAIDVDNARYVSKNQVCITVDGIQIIMSEESAKHLHEQLEENLFDEDSLNRNLQAKVDELQIKVDEMEEELNYRRAI